MSRPWMPLYVADYLRDTSRLSTLEHGAYLLLIMDYWTKGNLPADDKRLARIAGLTDKEWKAMRPAIAELFQDGWKHKRIEAELAAAQAAYDRRAAAGQKGGNAKAVAKHSPSNATSMPDALQKQSLSQPTEAASAASPAAAAAIDLDEMKRRCEEAFGGALPRIDAIEKLIGAGHDFEGRILPLIREEAQRCKTSNAEKPKTWGYFKPVVEDASRVPLAGKQAVVTDDVTVERESPLWDRAAAAWLAEKGKPPPCPNGRWYFPRHMVEVSH